MAMSENNTISNAGEGASPIITLADDAPTNDAPTTSLVFVDPVGYLAGFGIQAEVVDETAMPIAA